MVDRYRWIRGSEIEGMKGWSTIVEFGSGTNEQGWQRWDERGVITAAQWLLVLVAIKRWSKGFSWSLRERQFIRKALKLAQGSTLLLIRAGMNFLLDFNDENLPRGPRSKRSIFGGYWHICWAAKTHNWQFHIGTVRKKTPWHPHHQSLLSFHRSIFLFSREWE